MSPTFFDDPITPEAVRPLLLALVDPGTPWAAGVPLEYLESCSSTNALLRRVADTAPTGTTLVTDEQTGGRGRSGRTWISAAGKDLTFSVLLRPLLPPGRGHLLSLATGAAVAQVLESEFGLHGAIGLKWPNDVLLVGKKVCGILFEASAESDRFRWAVAGVGLNVNGHPSTLPYALPPDQAAEWRGRPSPISLKEYFGAPVRRAPLLAALLVRLTRMWAGLEETVAARALLVEWRRRDALAGRRVEVLAGPGRAQRLVAGTAAGIGENGQLLIRRDDGESVEVFAGDVSVEAWGPASESGLDLTEDAGPG